MADTFTPNLNLRKPEVGAAISTWGGPAGLNGDLDLLDAIFLATGLGTSVGLHVGTGKVLNVEGAMQAIADGVTLLDSADHTKKLTLSAANIPTATTVNLAAPNVGGTIATIENVQANSMPLASQALGTGSTAFLNVTFPLGARSVLLHWFLEANPFADVNFRLQGSITGVPQSAAKYHLGRLVNSVATVFADQTFNTTNWLLSSAAAQCWGNATFVLPHDGVGNGAYTIRNNAAVRTNYNVSFETDTTFASFNGFYLSCATGNFSANSFVRCFALAP